MNQLILEGLVIGFIGAATIGPIAMLIIQRVIERGVKIGVVSGMGVALADGIFGFVGGLGLGAINQFLDSREFVLRLGSLIILAWLGAKIYTSSPKLEISNTEENAKNKTGAMFSVLLLTLSNPVTILYFASVYANLNLSGSGGMLYDAGVFGLSVFVGSYIWWLVLSGFTGWFRNRLKPELLGHLNKVTGVIIIGFAIMIGVDLLGLL